MYRYRDLRIEFLMTQSVSHDSSKGEKKKMCGEWMRTWIVEWLDDGQTDVDMDEWVSRWIRIDG